MNPRLAGIAPSLIRAIAAKRRPTSIDLGLGEPTLRPDMRHFEYATQQIARLGCPYTANSGDAKLRERIAAHYAYPGMASGDNVCVTSGSQEALYAAISALLGPDDELLIIEPAFGSYAKIAELAGVAVRTVSMDAASGFAFDAERILHAITPRTRMIALCSPCNPSGRVLSTSEGIKLAAGLSDRSGPPVMVLYDEVYRELSYTADQSHFATIYPHTVVINSLSKSNALTGLRLGWAIAPKPKIDAIVKLHSWATSTASTYAQHVAMSIFEDTQALRAQHAWYDDQAGRVRALLGNMDVIATPLEGAFYSLLRFPKVGSSLDAALALAEHDDVLMVPGIAFGMASESWLRMSYVAPVEAISEALIRANRRFA